MNTKNTSDSLQRWVAIAIVLLGFVLSLGTGIIHFKGTFRYDAAEQIAAIEQEVAIDTEALYALLGLYRSSREVERFEFREFALEELDHHSSIHVLEWIPRVPHADREKFEFAAQMDGLPGFQFTERRSGKMIRRQNATEYFPVYFVEPLAKNQAMLGYDLASDPARLAALQEARDTGELIASAGIQLVQEASSQRGVLFFLPFYEGEPITVADRQEQLRGFVLGVFHIGELVRLALGESSVDFGLTIRDTLQAEKFLLHRIAPGDDLPFLTAFTLRQKIIVGGRIWELQATPTVGYLFSTHGIDSLIIFISGIVSTILLAAFLHHLMVRNNLIRQEVRLRTQELAVSEARVRAMLDTSPVGVVVIDEHGIMQEMNPAAEYMFGYSTGELVGQNVSCLMPEPYRSAHDTYLRRYLETGEAHILGVGREAVGQKKDGSTFPIHLSVGHAKIAGSIIFVGFIMDITRQKEAETALIAAKIYAEEAHRVKSGFISMATHELRTSLAALLGAIPNLCNFAGLQRLPLTRLLEMYGDTDTELPDLVGLGYSSEVSQLLQKIWLIANGMIRSGEDLNRVINDVLDTSKIEAGKIELHPESLHLAPLVQAEIAKIQSYAEEKGKSALSIRAENLENLQVVVDPARLGQILCNLLSNAVKFTDVGEIVVVAAKRDDMVEISVRDTGCGIPADQLEFIFQSFRQVVGTRHGGTGLGLSITKKLVELHGGSVMVTSTEGEGSTFTFTLPYTNEEKRG